MELGLDGKFPEYGMGLSFSTREIVCTQEQPMVKGPRGGEPAHNRAASQRTSRVKGLGLFAGSGEPGRVSGLQLYITQSLVRKMCFGKSMSSELNITETIVREFWQFLT